MSKDEELWNELFHKICRLESKQLDSTYHKGLLKEFYSLCEKIDQYKYIHKPEFKEAKLMTLKKVSWSYGYHRQKSTKRNSNQP